MLRVNSNVFFRNVSILAIGTFVSQGILVASTPVLTRLFLPSHFGLLALFTSISTMGAILTTGRYELAIGLPEEDKDAIKLTELVVVLSGIVSLGYFIILLTINIFKANIPKVNDFFHSPIVYLIPIFTFATATFTALQYWNQRKKKYKKITISNTLQVLSGTFFNLFFGLIGYKSFGLIFGLLLGQFVATIWLFHHSGFIPSIQINALKSKAKHYSSFPRYMIVSDFSSTTSQQIIPIIFSILFNSTIVGFFSLANRMLKVPAIILTSSISNVFRNEAIDVIRQTGDCKYLYKSTFKKLLLISASIYISIGLAAPFLFSIIFGKGWESAGYFAQVMCLMLSCDFIVVPFNSLFYILQKQKLYMKVQFLKVIFNITLIFWGFYLTGNPFYTVLFFASSDVVFSLITLKLSYNLAKHKLRERQSNNYFF